jgi:hypothetical protein
MADKIFVGKGWESKFGVRITIKPKDLEKLNTNSYGDVLLEVVKRKEPDPKSKATHYVVVDQYAYDKLSIRPEKSQGAAPANDDVF